MANKAFGILELLLKQVLAERLAKRQAALPDLLVAVRYGGSVQTVEKLPPGTLVEVLLKLADRDNELSIALPPLLRQALRDVVQARNDTTHEVLAPELRKRTRRLLDLIHEIITAPELAALLP